MLVDAWAETHCAGWEGVMPGEQVQLGLLGVVHSSEGPPCGTYVRGPVDGRVLVRAELVNPHPNYLFRCTA